MMLQSSAFWAFIGYLLGSIPFGVLLSRSQGIDLRSVGSGNIGATNVLRTGNKGLAAATLLLDGAKGAVAVLLARHFAGEMAAVLAGFAAFVGHIYPVWLRFHGGKGVATMLGVCLAAMPAVGLVFAVLWLGGALVTRYSSVGGLVAAVGAPVAALLFHQTEWALALAAMAALLWLRHAENLQRLRAGTESKIGQK
jgi:acyl phosphate:glycerol-3-phosphate acyltransferase